MNSLELQGPTIAFRPTAGTLRSDARNSRLKAASVAPAKKRWEAERNLADPIAEHFRQMVDERYCGWNAAAEAAHWASVVAGVAFMAFAGFGGF